MTNLDLSILVCTECYVNNNMQVFNTIDFNQWDYYAEIFAPIANKTISDHMVSQIAIRNIIENTSEITIKQK